jgi:hypothetical protein
MTGTVKIIRIFINWTRERTNIPGVGNERWSVILRDKEVGDSGEGSEMLVVWLKSGRQELRA